MLPIARSPSTEERKQAIGLINSIRLHRQILSFARQFYLTNGDSHAVIPVLVEYPAHLHRDFFFTA